MHGSRDGLLCGNQFRFALRRPRNSPAMHSSVSALQTSAWEPSPVLGEAAAGDGAAADGDELAGAGDGAAAYAEPLSERRHGCLRTYHKTQKAHAEHCSAQAFSHSQRNLWKTQPRGPRSLPRKVMASASGPVLADTTQPSWNTFTGGWPNSFLHCFTSSLTRSPSV